MAVVGYATIQLIPSMRGFSNTVNGQVNSAARTAGTQGGHTAGSLFSGGFIGAVAKIASAAGIYSAISGISSGFANAVKTGLEGVANLQSYSISFETLLGSAKGAKDMIADLYSFAAKTPFDVEGAVVGAQKLLGVNVAAKDIVPTLTTLGDAVSALGGGTDSFNAVLLAYSQIMARGKVSTQDLYQISNTGIPIFQLMSKALGKPVGEIQKLIETGKLASSDVLPKLLAVMNKDYGGAMAKQALTLGGLYSTFKDEIKQSLTTAFEPLAAVLQKSLPSATIAAGKAISAFGRGMTALIVGAQRLGPYITQAVGVVKTVWDGLATGLAPGISAIQTTFGNLGTTLAPLAQALAPFKTVLDGLVPLLPIVGGFIGSLASTIVSGLVTAFATVAPLVAVIGDRLSALFGIIGPMIGPVLSGVSTAVSGLVSGFLSVLQGVTPVITAIVSFFTDIQGGLPLIIGFAASLAAYRAILIGLAIATRVVAAAAKAWTVIQLILNAAVSLNPIGIIVIAIGALVAAIILVVVHWKQISAFVSGVWNVVLQKAGAIWQGFVGGLKAGMNAVLGFFRQWGPAILALVFPVIGIPLLIIQNWGKIVDFFVTIGPKIMQGLLYGIVFGATVVYLFFSDVLPRKIAEFLIAAKTWLVTSGVDILNGLAQGIVTGYEAVRTFFAELPAKTLAFFVNAAIWLVAKGTSILNGLASGIQTGYAAVVAFFVALPGKVLAFLANAAVWLLTKGKEILDGLKSGIDNGFTAVETFFINLPGKLLGALGDLGSLMVSSGKSLLGGFARGITAGVATAVSAVKDAVTAVSDWFPHSPAPTGPFSGKGWTLYSGRSLVQGFAKGIQQRQGMLGKTMRDTFAVPTMGAVDVGPTVGNGLAGRFDTAASANGGNYIGTVNFGADKNSEMVGDLAFMLRNLTRGGR